MTPNYDVIVVGLGHAGCEAALACARIGLKTAGITLRQDRIAVMSCNPAVGGTAKGHLVRELDALGGEMARTADATGTHCKLLNASKGPAVRASRVLCDRDLYAQVMQSTLAVQANLEIIEGEVSGLLVEGRQIAGLSLASGTTILSRKIVLTTGTFLQAVMHEGEKKSIGGRLGDGAATGLSDNLRSLGFELGRFKTGTPARLKSNSIDYSRCEVQQTDAHFFPLSLRSRPAWREGQRFPRLGPVTCHITYTNDLTHQVIRQNLHRSPLYQGEIVGRGPRYCPSLEDKVVRFAQRLRHQIFLEPEGLKSEWVYPAGISTSLPAEVQLEFLRTVPGLEEVEVARYGYAVEYDYAPPLQLKPTLETRLVDGLYFAGQLNGTSGYEEAAFQGLLAGINAAQSVKGADPLILSRRQAHGGVLLNELVTKGVDEPFRMLTSRSEHRLRLREGNADLRLVSEGHRVGLVGNQDLEIVQRRQALINDEIGRLESKGLAANLRRPEVNYAQVVVGDPTAPFLDEDVCQEVEVEIKYAGYIAQHDRTAAREESSYDDWQFPGSHRFADVRGLSTEVAEKLDRLLPLSLGQARKIAGVTPAAISVLLIYLRKARRADATSAPVDKLLTVDRFAHNSIISGS